MFELHRKFRQALVRVQYKCDSAFRARRLRCGEALEGCCQLNRVEAIFVLTACGPGPRSAGNRHRLPFVQRPRSEETMMSSSQEMTPDTKEILDDAVN